MTEIVGVDPHKFSPYSGTKKVSGSEAADKLGISERLGGNVGFNASAAAISHRAFTNNPDAKFNSETFQQIYGITVEEARQLEKEMYGD